MLDQSFSTKNLRKVYDSENRKGDYIETGFPLEVTELSKNIKRWRSIKRRLRRARHVYSEETYRERLKRIREKIKSYDEQRSEKINSCLEKVVKKISEKKFKLEIEEHSTAHHKKPTYRLVPSLESFFAGKQLQHNIKLTYGVKQNNRDSIVSQLKEILDDKVPKHIIRTDIESFYENIDRKILAEKINNKPQLSLVSRKMIKQVLKGYQDIAGDYKGIPRGVGVSAYLAELYMVEVDEKIKSLPGLVYYSRYVDDIVAVFSFSPEISISGRRGKIEDIISSVGLSLHGEGKTKEIDFVSGKNFSFDYLGYKFQYQGRLKIGASKSKVDKYKERIVKSIGRYEKSYKSESNKNMLIKRMRFLTGNTKLTNNKGGAFVGIYSSNKWMNDSNILKGLDGFFHSEVKKISCPRLRRRLSKLSFEEGFERRVFRKFSARELGNIVKAWKH